jgi:hypothetical protein
MGMTVVFDALQEKGEAQYGAARLEAKGGWRAVVAAGFQISPGLAQDGAPGQDYCRVETDGRYVIGAIADGFSKGARPEVLPRWVVMRCVEFLGQSRQSPPSMAHLTAHLTDHLDKLQDDQLSGEGCEVGAFIYDQAERCLSVYLISQYDTKGSREDTTPVIAAVCFPSDGRRPEPVYVSKASHFSELGIRRPDGKKAGSGEMCRFDGVNGFMLSSDGFHWPKAGRRPDWVALRALLCDGVEFMDSDSLKGDDRCAIFVGAGADVADLFHPIGDVLTVTQGESQSRELASRWEPGAGGTARHSGAPAARQRPNPRARTHVYGEGTPSRASRWRPWHAFVACALLGLVIGAVVTDELWPKEPTSARPTIKDPAEGRP